MYSRYTGCGWHTVHVYSREYHWIIICNCCFCFFTNWFRWHLRWNKILIQLCTKLCWYILTSAWIKTNKPADKKWWKSWFYLTTKYVWTWKVLLILIIHWYVYIISEENNSFINCLNIPNVNDKFYDKYP